MKATDMIRSHKIFELDPAATMFALGRNEKGNMLFAYP